MPTAVDVFNRLRTKIGEEEAKVLVEFVQESIEKGAASKEDIHRLERRIDQVKFELEQRIDRILYVVILLFLIFNGDKVIAFFSSLWKLTG